MPLGKNNQRVKPDLFQSGCEQQCQIKAGSDTSIHDLGWAAYLLPLAFKAGRRVGVVNSQTRYRAPDRRSQFPSPFGPILVTIQGCVFVMLAQCLCHLLEQVVNGRVIWLHESRHHVGKVRQASPLISRQKFNRLHRLRQYLFGCVFTKSRESEGGGFGFRQTAQQGCVQLHIEITKRIL